MKMQNPTPKSHAIIILSLLLFLSLITVDSLLAKINIMPLGDSITYDNRNNETRPTSVRTGYRQPLWLDLISAGYDVDFVGSLEAGESAFPPFDPDNEGHNGFNADQIRDNIDAWLTAAATNPDQGPVDVVLLHIGTNDISGQTPADVAIEVREILENIDGYDSGNGVDIWVILARIINRVPVDTNTTSLNNEIQSMADTRIAAGDKIIVVNMENKLIYASDQSPPFNSGDFWDINPPILHPNTSGYDKMATTWFDEGLSNILPLADAGENQSVTEGNTIQLDGSFSIVPQVPNGNFSIVWDQIAGPIVNLVNQGTLTPSFTAPAVTNAGVILQFRLKISDDDNDSISDEDVVTITVSDAIVSTVSNGSSGGGGGCFIQTVSGLFK